LLNILETVSHYQVLEKLGEGGMGEVYLVSDTKLSRKAALKILPSKLAVDRKYLNRFLQEARLAATLNHPNICTVYEINEGADAPFIAMEYVEGRTLAEMLDSKAFEFGDVVEIAMQVADALDEAHRHGIIHRDIKAANIIINKRGRVKVLDFGLAKSFDTETSEQEVTRAKTESGMLVGTVQYMSPEQALGKELDGRTDLWSLGVMLYELTTGQLPFKGATVAATFSAILHEEPAPPRDIAPDVPTALEQIISRLLEKDRELRYQTASDLRADLKRLQRNSSVSVRRVTGETLANSAAVQGLKKDSAAPKRTDTVQVKITQPEMQVAGKSRNFLFAGLGLLVLFGVLTAGYFIYSNSRRQTVVAANNFRQGEMKRLTNYGKISDAVISSDGKYMAYAIDDNGSESLWLKQLATQTKIQLLAPSNVSFQGLAISPDSNWVYYNIWDKKSVGQIWRVPTIGEGTPQKVIHDCMPGISVAPDGKRLAFVRSSDERKQTLFLTANADNGSDERELITKDPQNFGFASAAWSPDGKTIAIGGFRTDEKGQPVGVIAEVAASGGEPQVLWSAPNFFVGNGLAWLPDRKGFLLTALNPQQSIAQIWQVSLETGEAQQITKDYNTYGNLSITADGKSLVTTQQDFAASVWVVPADNPSQARRVTNGKLEGIGLTWLADNKLVYGSTLTGNLNLWVTDLEGSNQRQLVRNDGTNTEPCAFDKGERVGFLSATRAGSPIPQVWQVNVKSGEASQVTNGGGSFGVICGFNDNHLYYGSVSYSEDANLWQTSVDGGEKPIKINKALNYRPAVSNDGKRVAYVFWDEKEKRLAQEILDFETGATRPFQLPLTAIRGVNQPGIIFRWTADSKGISYISDEKEVSNIWTQPLDGGKPKQVTNFNESYILHFAWSPDGKYLAATRGSRSSDVILIKSE
jgi:eukaryotic-like serine/threonine-protein kinase